MLGNPGTRFVRRKKRLRQDWRPLKPENITYLGNVHNLPPGVNRFILVLAPDPVAGDTSGVHGPEPTRSRSGHVLEDTRAIRVVVLPPGLLGWPASKRKNGFKAAFLLPCASGRS